MPSSFTEPLAQPNYGGKWRGALTAYLVLIDAYWDVRLAPILYTNVWGQFAPFYF